MVSTTASAAVMVTAADGDGFFRALFAALGMA
jgi:hypothetical protein